MNIRVDADACLKVIKDNLFSGSATGEPVASSRCDRRARSVRARD